MINKRSTTENDLLFCFGLKLRILRQSKNLTQEQLASLAGFSRSYYTEIETGKRNISLLNMYKLADALEINICDFFDTENNLKGDI